jgi:hypothetical protein
MSLLVATLVVLLITGGMARCSQRHFNRWGDAFRCRLRLSGYTSAIWPRMGPHWSRPMWALWNEDVLVVRRGPIRARVIPLRAQVMGGGVRTLSSHELRRCGPQPVSVVLRIWDGSYMEVAAADEDRLSLVGPYLAAALNDLPTAPIPRHQT